jgi:polar amino acid transport system substrate-binding protein
LGRSAPQEIGAKRPLWIGCASGLRHTAAGLPKGRSAAAQAALATLVDEAKQTGVVQKAIDAKGLKGVNVAAK